MNTNLIQIIHKLLEIVEMVGFPQECYLPTQDDTKGFTIYAIPGDTTIDVITRAMRKHPQGMAQIVAAELGKKDAEPLEPPMLHE
jgi:hypothetical protein